MTDLLDEIMELSKILNAQDVPKKGRYVLIHEDHPWYPELEKRIKEREDDKLL